MDSHFLALFLAGALLVGAAMGNPVDMETRHDEAMKIRQSDPNRCMAILESLIKEGYKNESQVAQSQRHRKIGNCLIRLNHR